MHFQASDRETSVYVNGSRVSRHRGGYDLFSFDVTNYLVDGQNTLTVCVWDATAQQCQAIGKQILPENRQGFRYQPTGGIWQTVWKEAVPENFISTLKMIPDVNKNRLELTVFVSGNTNANIKAQAFDGNKLAGQITGPAGQSLNLSSDNPKLWSPDQPFLYNLEIQR